MHMAKRAKTSRSTTKTTKTTTTGSRRPTTVTTKTTTVRSNGRLRNASARKAPAPKKSHNLAKFTAIVIILLALVVAVYFLTMPMYTLSQQQGQLAGQVSAMQNSNYNLTLFYLANAQNYHYNVNQSWSVEVTDQDANGSVVGQLTISWNGQSKNLSIQNGIVTTGISPTYAVTLSHGQFMALSQDIITRNTAAAFAYYTAYYLTGKINYTRLS
jgi:hypothetical protein